MGGRIIILNDTLTARGGASALAVAAARGLRARGREVVFLVGDRTSDDNLAPLGIEVRQIGSGRLTMGADPAVLLRAAYNRDAYRAISRIVEEYDAPDTVYYVHSWSKSLSSAVFDALADVRGSIVVHAHDFFLACPNGAFFDYQRQETCERRALSSACVTTNCDKQGIAHKVYRLARHAILQRALSRCERMHLIAIHESMLPFLAREGFDRERVHVVRNPSDPLCAPVEAERNRRFLFLGRLEKEKGPDLLCAAAQRADIELTLVGQGELKGDLERRYPQFQFTGWLDKEAIKASVRNVRCIVMPSRYPEPFGLVAAEALGAGIPVIAAETAFLAKDLLTFGCGVAVDPFDETAFSEVLATLDRDDAQVERMSRAALTSHRALSPTWHKWLGDIEGVFDSALGGNAKTERTSVLV